MMCHEWTLVKSNGRQARLISLPCKSWTCEHCAEQRRKMLIAEAMAGRPTTFITLTSNPRQPGTPTSRRILLAWAWNVIVKRAKREFGIKTLPYFVVCEKTKAGEPHLHILARAPFIPQRWLSAAMAELTNAPICDIRRVNSASHAAAYVAKYVGKEPAQFGKLKRYWKSQDYSPADDWQPSPDEMGDGQWSVVKQPLHEVLSDWCQRGWCMDEVEPQRAHLIWLFDAEPQRAARPPP
jgi:hypothetical protein